MANNGLLLPELIINKNKINFGNKSFKMEGDSQKQSSRQQKDGKKSEKTRRKKNKRDRVIEEEQTSRRTKEKHYVAPKRYAVSHSVNPNVITGQNMHNLNLSQHQSPNPPIKVLRQNQVNLATEHTPGAGLDMSMLRNQDAAIKDDDAMLVGQKVLAKEWHSANREFEDPSGTTGNNTKDSKGRMTQNNF